MFDENFWQQILPQIEFFLRRTVVSELLTTDFKEVKDCINMVAGKTSKNKEKK